MSYEKVFFYNESGKEYCNEELALSILLKEGILFANSREYIERSFKNEKEYTIEPETIVLFVNCNDLFCWGCADAECLTLDEVPALYRCWEADEKWGVSKWCCKRRNLKPQKPILEDMKKDGVWDEEMEKLLTNENEN